MKRTLRPLNRSPLSRMTYFIALTFRAFRRFRPSTIPQNIRSRSSRISASWNHEDGRIFLGSTWAIDVPPERILGRSS